MTPFAIQFRRDVSHGRCVGVALPDRVPADVLAALPAAEREQAERLPPARQVSWVGGRLALRAALADLGVAADPARPILSDARGAPTLPPDTVGSITHKKQLALALAASDAGWNVGIDLEDPAAATSRDISKRVLGVAERDELAALPDPQRRREVLIRFAAKEAIYKALDRFVQRFVSFHEAAVHRQPDGTLTAQLTLRAGEGPFDVELAEPLALDHVIVTARVRPRR